MQKESLNRVFQYSGIKLPDPDSSLNPIEVRDFFAMAGRPELSSAEVRGPEVLGNELVYTLHRAVGTKGSQEPTKPIISQEIEKAMEKFLARKSPGNHHVNTVVEKMNRNQSGRVITPPSELIPWFF